MIIGHYIEEDFVRRLAGEIQQTVRSRRYAGKIGLQVNTEKIEVMKIIS